MDICLFSHLTCKYLSISFVNFALHCQRWDTLFQKASSSLESREENVATCSELIECDLTLLGATGIEDKLQDQVPETISLLKKGGIKIWVLTGDKMETAVNIGFSCSLLSSSARLIYLTDEKVADIRDQLVEHLSLINR